MQRLFNNLTTFGLAALYVDLMWQYKYNPDQKLRAVIMEVYKFGFDIAGAQEFRRWISRLTGFMRTFRWR
jgi:hypothetical protein